VSNLLSDNSIQNVGVKVEVDGEFILAEVRGLNVRVRLHPSEPEKCFKGLLKLFEVGGLKLSQGEKTELLKQFNAAIDPLFAAKGNEGEVKVEHSIPEEVLKKAEEKAEEILASDNPIQKLKEECLDYIIAGEDENKVLLTILLLSGKYAKIEPKTTQIVVLGGSPGIGKSELACLSRAFNVKEVGRLTRHAVDYTDLAGYEVFYIKEMAYLDVDGEGVATLRFLSTEDGGYTVEYVVRDESGRFRTESKKVPPITVITTTNRVLIDSQMERRAWILNPDESEEQTLRILEFKAWLKEEEQLVKLGLRECTSKEFAQQVLKALVAKLEPVKVVVPYTKTLTDLLNYKVLRARGDYDKIHTLILLTAFLMQKKLPSLKDNVVLATPSVILHALKVSAEPIATMSTQLDKRIRALIKELNNLGIMKIDDVITHEDRVKIAKKLARSEKTIKNYLKKMVEEGYAVEEADPNIKGKKQHRLIKSLEEIVAAYSSLNSGKDSGNREFPLSTIQKAYHETIEFLNKYCGKDSSTVKEKIKADVLGCLANFSLTSPENFSAILGSDKTIDVEAGKNRFPEFLPDQQPPKPRACEECEFWSRNSCLKHQEWVAVLPSSLACEFFKLRGEI